MFKYVGDSLAKPEISEEETAREEGACGRGKIYVIGEKYL
jgi:hypothetical protein